MTEQQQAPQTPGRPTIADRARAEARKQFAFGLGPNGEPYAYHLEDWSPYRLTRAADVAELERRIALAYLAETSSILPDRHLRTAMGTLKAEAEEGEPIPQIEDLQDDDDVQEVEAPSGSIDVRIGEVALARMMLGAMSGRTDIFVSGTSLTQVVRDSDGRAVASAIVDPQEYTAWADAAGYRFHTVIRGVAVDQFLPSGVARQVLKWQRYDGVLPLVAISRTPVVTSDGTILEEDGYSHGIYCDIDQDLKGLAVPENPTDEEVKAAIEVINDLYAGFPFVDQASKANAIGLAMTAAALRVMHPDEPVPVHAAIAAAQGTGKSVVAAELPGVLAGGHDLPTFTEDEAELRKAITTALTHTSARVLCLDNVKPSQIFESGVLAKALTSTRWTDRMLGSNTPVSCPQDRLWTVTGNNLRVGRDMAARTVPIHLDARMEDPSRREFDVRLDDPATLLSIRPRLIRAALTIVRAWVLAGSPESGDGPPMRQFSRWARRCGGLLRFMGIDGHLTNRDSIVEQDQDAVAMGTLYAALREVLGLEPFTIGAAYDVLDARPQLDERLPDWIVEKIQRAPSPAGGGGRFSSHLSETIKRSLGNTFRQRKGEFYGGLAIERVGHDRLGWARWRLFTDQGLAESAESLEAGSPPFVAEIVLHTHTEGAEEGAEGVCVCNQEIGVEGGVSASAESADSAPDGPVF